MARALDAEAAADITLENFLVHLQLTEFQVNNIVEVSSLIGEQDFSSLVNFIDFSSYIVLPIINSMIPKLRIPSLISGVEIEEASFVIHDDYLYATFSPVYVGNAAEIWREKFHEAIQRVHEQEEAMEVAILE